MWRIYGIALCVCGMAVSVNSSSGQGPGWSAPSTRSAEHSDPFPSPIIAGPPAPDGRIRRAGFDAPREPEYAATGFRTTSLGQVMGTGQYPTVRLSGFFQADGGLFAQSSANRAAVGDIQDEADFRRARLQAIGDVWNNVGYSIEFDFAFPGRPSFMDVWMEIRDVIGGGNLRIGQYRQPIGMDGLTNVKELTFIERALPFALLPFRQIGAMWHTTGPDDASTFALSLFRFPTGPFGGNFGDNGGYSFATRVTGLLVDDGDGALVHVGGAFSFMDPSNDAVRYRDQPEFFVSETGGAATPVPSPVPPFVDTGAIPTDNISLLGAELAGRFGQLHLQSELLVSVVQRIGAGSVVFPGMYVQAGYLLTGEVRPYNRKAGVLGRINPNSPFSSSGGRGAWEVAARWSYLDLSDASIRGGKLNDLTFGLNWYLNPHTKFQFNYIIAFLDSPVNNHSTAGIATLRAQVDF